MAERSSSRGNRGGLLRGATKYFRSGRSKSPGAFSSKTQQPDLVDSNGFPVSVPQSGTEQALVSPLGKKISKRSSRRTMSTAETSWDSLVGSPNTAASAPVTPKAKKKKRRRATMAGATPSLHLEDSASLAGRSVPDSAAAVISPTKKKKKRRNSMGAMDEKKKTKSRSSRSKHRESSTRRGAADLMTHLESHEQHRPPSQASLRNEPESHSPRSRTTVDVEGRIRRVKISKSSGDEDTSETESRRSKTSKSSRGNRRDGSEKGRSRSKRSSNKREKGEDESLYSEASGRSGRESRRRGKTPIRAKSDADVDKVNPDGLSYLPNFDNEFGNLGQRMNESFRSQLSDTSAIKESSDLVDIGPAKVLELEKEIDRLNKTIADLNESQLTVQFQSQTEVAQLRKELREKKLELQRSQTERRELRAELRERDFIIDESENKIAALEKAVEMQLDKVDELEEELKRANAETTTLEDKLKQIEGTLLGEGIVPQNGDDTGQQRSRLEERERHLEERERKLQEDRENISLSLSDPQAEAGQLEHDNRMLLKALSREKSETEELLKSKDIEIENLHKQLKDAKLRSYSHIVPSGEAKEESLLKLIEEKDALQAALERMKENAESTIQKKNETISFLEMETKRLKGERPMDDTGGFDSLKRDLEASQVEAQVMKSKFDGAQRRNQILEDDIDHWKSVNCNLEDELAEWKTQAANWREKYENAVDGTEEEVDPALNILPFSLSTSGAPADIALGSRHEDNDSGKNAITSLWSKLTTPTSSKQGVGASGMLSDAQIQDTLARTTFH